MAYSVWQLWSLNAICQIRCHLSGTPGVIASVSSLGSYPRPLLQEDTQDVAGCSQKELGWGSLKSKADEEHNLAISVTHDISLYFLFFFFFKHSLHCSGQEIGRSFWVVEFHTLLSLLQRSD